MMTPRHIIAADIGNSRMKFARFVLGDAPQTEAAAILPEPIDAVTLSPGTLNQLEALIPDGPWRQAEFAISSVQRTRTADVIGRLKDREFSNPIRLLTVDDLLLVVDVPRPQRVGIDRLLGAVAANQLRPQDQPAIVVDLGTAITVDVIDARGAFRGGAIAPGLAISAKALHEATDLLPDLDVATLDERMEPIGRDTVAAMKAGLFLGAVGGIRELITRQLDSLNAGRSGARQSDVPFDEVAIFVSGGLGSQVAHLLSPAAQHLPHLVLQGVAVAMAKGAP